MIEPYDKLWRPFNFQMKAIASEIMKIRESGKLDSQAKTSFQDVVTAGDKRAEEMLTEFLEMNYPDDGIWGEEGSMRISKSGRRWILDPIDGSGNYASGPPIFGISAGREQDGIADIGAMYFPGMKKFFFAERGRGAIMAPDNCPGHPIQRLFNPTDLRETTIAVDLPREWQALWYGLNQKCLGVTILRSCTFAVSLVAGGRLGAYYNPRATPFDLAAAVLIAEEAGCVSSQEDGKEIDLRMEHASIIIAANPEILDQMIYLCRAL